MSLLTLAADLAQPVTQLIDRLHTSDDEKAKAKQALLSIQSDLLIKALSHEQSLAEAKARVITAEAQGQSWLQRSWRPITMLTFLLLVVLDTLGLTHFRLSEQAWSLLQIGLGGYVVGRSVEKVAPSLAGVLKGVNRG